MKCSLHFQQASVLLALLLCTLAGCESGGGGHGSSYAALVQQAWAVRVLDGVTMNEARILATAYLYRYVNEEGSIVEIVDGGSRWQVNTTHGTLYVHKTEGKVSMQYGPTVEPQDF